MLRVVPALSEGQNGDPPKPDKRQRPRPERALSEPESGRLRVLLRNLRGAYGGWDVLAAVLGVTDDYLHAVNGQRAAGSHRLVMLAAKAGGLSVEQALAGKLPSADVCPTCGAVRGAS